MADSNDRIFLALCQTVHGDPALQARLFGLADANEFIAAVQQLAHAQGHVLQKDEVRHALRLGRKCWSDRKLP